MHRFKVLTMAILLSTALGIAGCGGGGGGTAEQLPPMPTPQETCEAADGRYNPDGTCTSAADLAAEAAAMEAVALKAAQDAADVAAMAANAALNSAKDAVTAAAANRQHDELHYGLAVGALNDARRAKQAADTANQAAMDAETSEAAKAAQADAEAARTDAEAALALASSFASAVQDAKDEYDRMIAEDRDEEERQRIARENDMKISDAREAARLASVAASEAATAAQAALNALQADADATAHQLVTATTAKIAADAAAKNAADAYAAAMIADTVEAAEAARDSAQMAQSVAEAQQGIIDGFNMANQGNRDDDENEKQRMAAVADARSRANTSAMEADADATKAEEAADRVEAIAPNSPHAEDARSAAIAARTAATMAQEAHNAITDDMTKEDADAQAAIAANQAMSANGSYMTASNIKDTAETNLGITQEENRKRDIANATREANAAAMAAKNAYDAADAAAVAAETARDNARAALDRAKAARTDTTEAQTQYDAANTAATAARRAANNANTAYMAAMAAHEGIDPAGTVMDALAAQDTAKEEQGKAETALATAMMQQGLAETAETDAGTASSKHVLRLFLAANGAHVEDDDVTSANETAAHVTSVGAAMATIAAATDGAQAGAGTTASVTWPAFNTVDDPATPDVDESVVGTLSIVVNPAGVGNIPFETGATRAADTTATPPVTARIQTARKIADLGTFQGYELWENDEDATTATDRARAIVFTNKTQDDPAVVASDVVAAREVSNIEVTSTTVTKLGTKSGNTYTGAEYTPDGEAALTGTLTCPSGTTCSVDATTATDGTVTINSIDGYVFTGSREAKAAVTAASVEDQATANSDYLVFGIWLDENEDGTTDTFGAFALGGAGYEVNVQNAVTGTATYSGKAAGAHHKTGEGVNFFDGDARLTANFVADDAAGTISGAISNIRVNGGAAMSAPIYLGEATLTDGEATFNGAAFMGAPTAPGASTHEFDGTWSGSFFGGTLDDGDTTDVDESVTAPLAAAGTFGVTKSTGTGDDIVIESFVGAFGANKQQ